jgi:hypothetical protein
MVARVDEIRPHFERGHIKSIGPQPGQNTQGQCGFSRTAAGGGNDTSFNGSPLFPVVSSFSGPLQFVLTIKKLPYHFFFRVSPQILDCRHKSLAICIGTGIKMGQATTFSISVPSTPYFEQEYHHVSSFIRTGSLEAPGHFSGRGPGSQKSLLSGLCIL